MIEWRKARTLKDYLARIKILTDTEKSKSNRCNDRRCEVCQYIEETCEFEDAEGNKYGIRKGIINCNIDFTVYKFHFSSYSKHYVGSNVTGFRYRCNSCMTEVSII